MAPSVCLATSGAVLASVFAFDAGVDASRHPRLAQGLLRLFVAALIILAVVQAQWPIVLSAIAFCAAEHLSPRDRGGFWTDATRLNLLHTLLKRPAIVAALTLAIAVTDGRLSSIAWGLESRH